MRPPVWPPALDLGELLEQLPAPAIEPLFDGERACLSQLVPPRPPDSARRQDVHALDVHAQAGMRRPACPRFVVLPDLEELSLTECRGTTDKAMIFIGQLEPLKKLKLGDGELTDDGLRSLEHLSKLTELNLGWCTQITDAGIPSMVKLSTLSRLTLSGTKVSPQGILNLREKLPGCVIVKD